MDDMRSSGKTRVGHSVEFSHLKTDVGSDSHPALSMPR